MPRRPKNHRPDLNGLLVVDKPVGPTSMDVCRVVRRLSGGAKVGHAGTLDPLASGVLVVCLGSATRTIDAIMGAEKRYLATLDLSAFSSTDDLEGERFETAVAEAPTLEQIRAAGRAFVGVIQQRPPAHSAVHVGGRRSYEIARRAAEVGGSAERPPARPVVVHSIEVVDYAWPALTLDIRCGKGTYIRSLARDLGEALGTGGMLTALRRTAVGPWDLASATPLDALPERIEPADLLPAPERPVKPDRPASGIAPGVEHEHASDGSS